MRLTCILTLAAALTAICLSAPITTATADGAEGARPARPAKARVVRRRAAGPQFAHVFNRYGYPATSEDPWAYSYEPVRYYPYYNSNQWRPPFEMRYRYRYDFALSNYYSSWGYPLVCHTPDWQACRDALAIRRR